SRAVVGGQLTPISTLATIGARVVEVHGQGAGFAPADPAEQLAAVDAFAATHDLLATYRAALDRLRTLERERASLDGDERTRNREIELLTYQIDDIVRAELTPDEDDRVTAELPRLEHAERLGTIGSEVVALIDTDG